YRGKGGIWEKFQPVYFEEFLNNEEKRILYWKRKQEQWDTINKARPNKGHIFFKELYDQGKLKGLITQNIDGLHEKSGLPKEIMVNLHGNTLEVICLQCGFLISSEEVFKDMDLDKGVPICSKCNGLLKPNTISFGQNLKIEDLKRAEDLALACDLMVVMGSTLIVQPASTYPLIAKQNRAFMVIINLSETPLDSLADLVFSMKIEEFLKEYEK
ncbi:MAG: Sir2 family NAD-dependent protein deacetylase, partial [Spirochaetes bacterium]|nr:Sir2 family NAD-dependent protein deacetylase [Spirochaetota bacterium]